MGNVGRDDEHSMQRYPGLFSKRTWHELQCVHIGEDGDAPVSDDDSDDEGNNEV